MSVLGVTSYVCRQGLFRNYGDSFLEVFKPHLERLVWDTSHNHHDSSQRCAMEIIAGLVRGTKHWPYEKVSCLMVFSISGVFFVVVVLLNFPRKIFDHTTLFLSKDKNVCSVTVSVVK